MIKEPYLITSLPFDNSTTYDECDNTWSIVGNPVIVDTSKLDKGRFKTALYLDGSSYIYSNDKIILGDKDITVSIWFNIISQNANWGTMINIFYDNTENRMIIQLHGNKKEHSLTSVIYDDDIAFYSEFNKWHNISFCYVKNESKYYSYFNGNLVGTRIKQKKILPHSIYIGSYLETQKNKYHYFYGYIKYVKIYDGIAKWTTSSFDVEETYDQHVIQYNTEPTKRSVHRLYQFSYQSLYNYTINTKINTNIIRKINNDIYLDNIAYRYILHNIDIFYHTKRSIIGLSNTLFSYALSRNIFNNIILINKIKCDILLNIFLIFNINRIISNRLDDVFLNLKRIINKNKIELKDLKRLVKKKYTNIKWEVKRLIYNNINIINYIYRKKIYNGNNISDTIRSVISLKYKIIAFVTNPRYKLK